MPHDGSVWAHLKGPGKCFVLLINPCDAFHFLRRRWTIHSPDRAVVGPLVLGWSRWRAIDADFGLGALKEGLRDCARKGHLRGLDLDIMAHLISGAVNEGVFVIADAENGEEAFAALSRSVEILVRRVLAGKHQPACK